VIKTNERSKLGFLGNIRLLYFKKKSHFTLKTVRVPRLYFLFILSWKVTISYAQLAPKEYFATLLKLFQQGEMNLDFKTCNLGCVERRQNLNLNNENHSIWVFIIFWLSTNWSYNIYDIYIILLTHWRIQSVGTSRTFCQNRVEIAHLKSDPLPFWKPMVDPSSCPFENQTQWKKPTLKNSWIRPCDVFEFKCLIQFIGEGALLLYTSKYINWKRVTLISCFMYAIYQS
jgi:hypothetical protein